MALSTYAWITLFVFTHFFHGIITAFGGWFLYMRGAGKWGGGVEALDFRACPEGKVARIRIMKKRGLYAQYAGGAEAVLTEIRGLWGKRDMRLKQSDILNLYIENGGPIIIGREQVMKAIDREENRKDEVITRMFHENMALMDELGKKTHNVDEIVDKYTRKFQELGKAYSFGAPKSSSSTKRRT